MVTAATEKQLEEVSNDGAVPRTKLQALGRNIVNVTSTIGRCALQVAKVSLIVALIFGAVMLPVAQGVQLECQGERCYQVASFPSYTARMMNNGMQLVSNGTAACQLDREKIDTEATCEAAARSSFKYAKEHGMLRKINDPVLFREKGAPITLTLHYQSKAMRFGMNSKKYDNYKEALLYVQKSILAEAVPFQGSVDEIIATIHEVHRLLVKDLPEETNVGTFRKDWIFLDPIEENPDTLDERAKKLLSPSEYRQFELALGLFEQFRSFTREELRILNKLMYVPPGPERVEKKMKSFASNLKKRLQTEKDPIVLASWVHQGIAAILPYKDANGRLARILMNAMLVRGGLDAAVFPDDVEYSQAVAAGLERPEAFTEYLRDHVLPWTRKQMAKLLSTEVEPTLFAAFLEEAAQNGSVAFM